MSYEHKIYTCSECPCRLEGYFEGSFYCGHPQRPDLDETSEPLRIFDGIPDWCPIRKEKMALVVMGNKA